MTDHPFTDEMVENIALDAQWAGDIGDTVFRHNDMRTAYDLAIGHFFIWVVEDENIRIDSQGFHYRGQLIEDAEEAHRLLLAFLRKHQEES